MEMPMARKSVWDELVFTFTMALKIMIYEPIVLSLGIYNGQLSRVILPEIEDWSD